MPTFVILAQSSTTATALQTWLDLLGEGDRGERRRIVFNINNEQSEAGTVAYRSLVTHIEVAAESRDGLLNLNDVVVMVDSIHPREMSAVAEGVSWSHLIAMLILTFPEVRWVFGCIARSDERFPREEHSLDSLVSHPRRDPLLDPTGIRDWVRGITNELLRTRLKEPACEFLPRRATAAAAIDEEQSYAYFIAYTAYRYGFRADTVTSWALMEWLFSGAHIRAQWSQSSGPPVVLSDSSAMSPSFSVPPDFKCVDLTFRVHVRTAHRSHEREFHVNVRSVNTDGSNNADENGLSQTVKPGDTVTLDAWHFVSHNFYLLLEDMYVKFPDLPLAKHLSWFEGEVHTDEPPITRPGRAAHCPLLDSARDHSECRILITTGHTMRDKEVLEANKNYLAGKTRGWSNDVLKPVGGVFDLWTRTKLMERLPGVGRSGNAPGFEWPPQSQAIEFGEGHGHGAPGKLTLIAETILRRANALRAGAMTVEACVRGAVLATEAVECISARTPTLALSALGLKHEFEVRAECEFVGAGHNFNVKKRIYEVESEVASITRWFSTKEQERCAWDAIISIINHLAVIFRSFGQFDEEHNCMVAVRKYHRMLIRPRELRRLLGWIPHVVLFYVEWLLRSFGHFLSGVLLWMAVSWGAWRYLDPPTGGVSGAWDWTAWLSALKGSSGAFVAGNIADKGNNVMWALSFVTATLGIFHIGVFIAYVYSLVSRR